LLIVQAFAPFLQQDDDFLLQGKITVQVSVVACDRNDCGFCWF